MLTVVVTNKEGSRYVLVIGPQPDQFLLITVSNGGLSRTRVLQVLRKKGAQELQVQNRPASKQLN